RRASSAGPPPPQPEALAAVKEERGEAAAAGPGVPAEAAGRARVGGDASAPCSAGTPYSYIALIAMAIAHAPERPPHAGRIYKFITERFPSTATTPKSGRTASATISRSTTAFSRSHARPGRPARATTGRLTPMPRNFETAASYAAESASSARPLHVPGLYARRRGSRCGRCSRRRCGHFPAQYPPRGRLPGAVYAGYAPAIARRPPPVYYRRVAGPCRVFGLVPERPLSPELAPPRPRLPAAGCAGARPSNPSAYAAAYAGPDGAYPQGASSALFAAAGRLAGPASPPTGGSSGGVEAAVDFYGRASPGQFGALGPCYNPGGQLGGSSGGVYHSRHAAAYPGAVDRFVSAM
uniref:Fork-head domain-containing protein n=1 Tax=Castor canadensis TaxID=51338 RepID=A0A8C0WCV8_CASCN